MITLTTIGITAQVNHHTLGMFKTSKQRLPSAQAHESGKPMQTDLVSKGIATCEPNWSEEEHEVHDACIIINAKKALKPMTTKPVVRGKARLRSPIPSAPRESRFTTPKQRLTDMAERDSYRRLRRPIFNADYARGKEDNLRYLPTPPLNIQTSPLMTLI